MEFSGLFLARLSSAPHAVRTLRNAVNGKTRMSLFDETMRFEGVLRDAGYEVVFSEEITDVVIIEHTNTQ